MTTPSQAILPLGTMVGGYRIEREVGRGAMAVVYRAIQLNLDRPVALKVLTSELAQNDEFVVRFFNEARAAAALSHAHIVQAYDAGVVEGNIHYFAMEFVEGETLLNRIVRQTFIRPGPGLAIAGDIADALNYGWQRQRLTHGDIKPENIMINTSGETKLADFGLAKVAEHDFEGSEIMLTPLYAAPEMIQGTCEKGDCRADIYSFGATLYHMFGGSPPFPGAHAQEVMTRHINEPLEPLKSRNSVIPVAVSEMVGRFLAKDPERRPQRWEEVLRELRDAKGRITERTGVRPSVRVRTDVPGSVRRAATVSTVGKRTGAPGTRFWLWLFLLAAVVAVAGLAMWHLGGGQPAGAGLESASAHAGVRPTGTPKAPGKDGGALGKLDWESVRRKVDTLSDPGAALKLLDRFRKQEGAALPADFEPLYKQYQEAEKWSRAAEDHSGTATPPLTAPSGTGTEATAENKTSPPQSTGRGGNESGVAAPTGTASAASSGNAGPTPAERAKLTLREVADAAIPLPLTPEDMRHDNYLRYLNVLSRFRYAVGRSVERYAKFGSEWLAAYPGACPERRRIAFLVYKVLPALDESLPRLVTGKDNLIGTKMPGTDYQSCRIRDVTLGGIQLEQRTDHGVMVRSVPWSDLSDPGYLVYLNRAILSKDDSSFADRRSLLALLLFTRYGRMWWGQCMQGLPDVPEKRLWETTRVELEQAAGEGQALALWQSLQDACKAGNRIAAYRLVRQLQQTRSATASRYQKILEGVAQQTAGVVPENIAGALVRQAQKALPGSPAKALTLVNLARARYGNADFPEKTSIASLQQRAIAGLAQSTPMADLLAKRPKQIIAPFVLDHAGKPPCISMIVLNEMPTGGDMSDFLQQALPILNGLAALEMGDWVGAGRNLPSTLPLEGLQSKGLPAITAASAVYAWGLLDERYSSSPAAADRVIRDLGALAGPGLGSGRDQAVVNAALIAEYALVTRQLALPTQQVLRWADMKAAPGSPCKRRFLLDALTFLLETGHLQEARSRLQQVLRNATAQQAFGLDEGQKALLHLVARVLDGNPPGAGVLSASLGGKLPEWRLRILLSLLLSQKMCTPARLATFSKYVESAGLGFGPVGGGAMYDLVLARVGTALSEGDLNAAAAAVDWGLDLQYPSLFPYYPRLLLLRGGLYSLVARNGRLAEIAVQIGVSPMSSRLEKALASGLAGNLDDVRSQVRARSQSRLWFAWLSGTDRLRRSNGSDQDKILSWFADEKLTLAEKRLVSGLERFAALKWPSVGGVNN